MTPDLSPNTQAILLLTAPLIAGKGLVSPDLLSPSEYRHLARHLREIQRQPADLLSADAAEILQACQPAMDEGRLQRLLGRGFLLGQVVEHWRARAIWVVSRADTQYPRRLKARLREDAPAILYGCGDISLLEIGGLAVVGSRHVDDALIDYTLSVGRLAAHAGRGVFSGGAKGIDQAAMRGALEAGGKVCGVLADSLEKTSMNRKQRNLLLDGQLALISPYDPAARFNVGNAMQRNKLIYALADASLVVSSDVNKGGTWAGAIEQLSKLRFVPVYVRSTGESSAGLDALRKKGAIPWPNPQDADAFESVFDANVPSPVAPQQSGLALYSSAGGADAESAPLAVRAVETPEEPVSFTNSASDEKPDEPVAEISVVQVEELGPLAEIASAPADALFEMVRELIQRLLKASMNDAEIAAALGVTSVQAKVWMQRLVDEGVIEKQKKPAGYVLMQKQLF